jgi:hypothetical protein
MIRCLRTKLHLHDISVYEYYAYYTDWNKKYELSQKIFVNCISSKSHLCCDMLSIFQCSPKKVCRMLRNSKCTVIVL